MRRDELRRYVGDTLTVSATADAFTKLTSAFPGGKADMNLVNALYTEWLEREDGKRREEAAKQLPEWVLEGVRNGGGALPAGDEVVPAAAAPTPAASAWLAAPPGQTCTDVTDPDHDRAPSEEEPVWESQPVSPPKNVLAGGMSGNNIIWQVDDVAASGENSGSTGKTEEEIQDAKQLAASRDFALSAIKKLNAAIQKAAPRSSAPVETTTFISTTARPPTSSAEDSDSTTHQPTTVPLGPYHDPADIGLHDYLHDNHRPETPNDPLPTWRRVSELVPKFQKWPFKRLTGAHVKVVVDCWAGSGRYRKEPQNPHRIFVVRVSLLARCCVLVCE